MIEPPSNESDHSAENGGGASMTMHDRPTVAELLDAIADTLDNRVLPAVDAIARHDVRVAANLCRIVRREVIDTTLDDQVADQVRQLIAAETGAQEATAAGPSLLTEMCRLIDRPDLSDEAEAEARRVAMAMVQAKLAVTQPGYNPAERSGSA